MDNCELAADAPSASREVVDDCCSPPAVAPSSSCDTHDAYQLTVGAALACGEKKICANYRLMHALSGAVQIYTLEYLHIRQSLRCWRGNTRPVDLRLVNQASPSDLDTRDLRVEHNNRMFQLIR